MNVSRIFIACVVAVCFSGAAIARQTVDVVSPFGRMKVEIFTSEAKGPRPAVIILSGRKGFGSAPYDVIAEHFTRAGLDVYLPHLLTPEDLEKISAMKSAGEQIAYYDQRRRDWTRNLSNLMFHLNRRPEHDGRVGILGIYLGAENAAIAVLQGLPVDAVVLVDGVPSSDHTPSLQGKPPFHLIWGSEDRVYPVASGTRFAEAIKSAGGKASMTVINGVPHDFFLKPDTTQAEEAYRSAINFLKSELRAD